MPYEHANSVVLASGLFLLGVVSPGSNFVVVAQNSLAHGRAAGFVIGLGVATGDALYAAAGLLGLSAIILKAGWLLVLIKIAGGVYLIRLGATMALKDRGRSATEAARSGPVRTSWALFRLGLLTDLSNPKTIVFFASIFAVTLTPETPLLVRAAMLVSIALISIAWRTSLAMLFSNRVVRRLYAQVEKTVNRVCGVMLMLVGAKLIV